MEKSADRPPRILVFSGAGLSAESGIQTFRGTDGLWEGHRIEEVCDFQTWKRNAAAVHRFYNERRLALEDSRPNAAHERLAAWQRAGHDVRLLTQNVDDLLERAGCRDVVHLHGHLTGMQCTACGHLWEIGYASWDPEQDRCPRCDSRKGVKPDVRFFGETCPEYLRLRREFRDLRPGDAVLVTGTSLLVIAIHETTMGLRGVQRILNVLRLEDIQADPRAVGRGFDRILACAATEALEEVERSIPWLSSPLG